MARARNNIMKLALVIRLRISQLLDDGLTYDEIRTDDQVAAECAGRGIIIHNSSLAAYREGVEFDEYRRRRREWGDKQDRRGMAAALATGEGGVDHMVDVANYLILDKALEALESGEIEAKEIAALARAAKTASERKWEKEKSEMAAKIAELSVTIQNMMNRETKVDSAKVAEDLDRALGVR